MTISPARLLLRELPSLAGPLPEFDPTKASDTPQEQFLAWLRDAVAAGVKEPHAMTLGTVDADGSPDARVLILKDLDERGWHFATSRQSPKGHQLSVTPTVSLTFYWPALGRQVRIRGEAVDLGREAAAADFWARSADARANAALARQSQVMEADVAVPITEAIDVPESWSVFAVKPAGVEFWQARTDRRHIRLRYDTAGASWKTTRLWP
jgi:pyridoxamine 5'-phosphate oxidase